MSDLCVYDGNGRRVTQGAFNAMLGQIDDLKEAQERSKQERDGLREQLEAAHRVNETWGRILKATRSEAILCQREHAALLADANAARERAEQDRDLLRRQVEAMIAPIAAACGRFGHLDMVLEMAHDPDGTENTNPWHACARDLWRAVKAAKEGGK
jgi:hypothetical protein